MNKVRLENFSDGVFAIAVTLLVLNIKIPDAKHLDNQLLTQRVLESIPQLLTFGFSFMVIGVFWVAHHRIFAMTKLVDSKLLWLNIGYLMFVAVMPYPAALMAENPFLTVSILIYCGTLFIIGLMHFVLLRHIYRSDDIKNELFTEHVYQSYLRAGVTGPAIYIFAGAFSFVHPYISFGLIISALVFYIFFSGKRLEQELADTRTKEERKLGRKK
jgi:TMEM175 potassium channel family protein